MKHCPMDSGMDRYEVVEMAGVQLGSSDTSRVVCEKTPPHPTH